MIDISKERVDYDPYKPQQRQQRRKVLKREAAKQQLIMHRMMEDETSVPMHVSRQVLSDRILEVQERTLALLQESLTLINLKLGEAWGSACSINEHFAYRRMAIDCWCRKQGHNTA